MAADAMGWCITDWLRIAQAWSVAVVPNALPLPIVNSRATVGGSQPAELDRMLKLANQKLAEQDAWIKEKRAKISASLAKLDADFAKLMDSGK